MHELSIAMSIVDSAREEAARHGATRINAVHLQVGALAGVVKDALLFSFAIACEDPLFDGCELLIKDVPVIAYCPKCCERQTIESIQTLACPRCGALTADVVEGRELLVTAIEIEE